MAKESPPQTLTLPLSDAAIRRHALDPHVRQLKAAGRPLIFRYRNNRVRGSWYLVTYHKGCKNPWNKIGNWPELSAASILEALPNIQQRLAIDPTAPTTVDGWQTVGELLAWWEDRVGHDRNKSGSRKDTVRSIIKCHLRPLLSELKLSTLNRAMVDAKLIWPLQARYSLSYVRQIFGVLMGAFRQAATLRLIAVSPVAGFKFPEFIDTPILPKGARLRPDEVEGVLKRFAQEFDSIPQNVALAVLMLGHGTRISETRLAKWKHLNLITREWFIPAVDTKTKVDLTLPLTDQMCAFLTRYQNVQKAKGYKGAYLFPASKRGPLNKKQASEVFQLLGLGDWTSHDLRKVSRTTWVDIGVDFLVGEYLLNHAQKGVSAAYIQTTLKPLKRKALEDWHAWLDVRGFALLHADNAPFGGETVARPPETSISMQGPWIAG